MTNLMVIFIMWLIPISLNKNYHYPISLHFFPCPLHRVTLASPIAPPLSLCV